MANVGVNFCSLSASAWIADRLKPVPTGAALRADVADADLLAAVNHHRVATALSLADGGGLTATALAALTALRRRRTQRLLRLTAELAAAVRALTAAKVPAIAFKGPAAGALLHGGAVRRDAMDLDLLVAPAAWGAALEILAGLGYRPLEPVLATDPDLRNGQALALRRPDGTAIVELHDRLTPEDQPFPLDVLRPFDAATIVDVAGVATPTLSAETAIVFAAYHGWKHLWTRLHWLNDVAAAARNGKTDWAAANDLAQRLGCQRHLALAVVMAAEILDAPIPENYPRALLTNAVVQRAKRATAPLVLATPPIADREAAYRLGLGRTTALNLALLSGAGRRWAALRGRLRPTADDRSAMPLPVFLRPLHYPARLARLLIRNLSFRRR